MQRDAEESTSTSTLIQSTQHPDGTQPGLDEDTKRRLEELDEYILLLERERW